MRLNKDHWLNYKEAINILLKAAMFGSATLGPFDILMQFVQMWSFSFRNV